MDEKLFTWSCVFLQAWYEANFLDFAMSVEWPQHSSDLNPTDYSALSILKARVPAKRHHSLEAQKEFLRREYERLSSDDLRPIAKKFSKPFDFCIRANGEATTLYFCGLLKLSAAYETHEPQPERFDLDRVIALRTRPRVQFASCCAHSIDRTLDGNQRKQKRSGGPPLVISQGKSLKEEIKLAERVASILKDFEARQLEVDEDEQLQVVKEQEEDWDPQDELMDVERRANGGHMITFSGGTISLRRRCARSSF
ncbi:unnamed protein product [Heligmosomoides polygyrus]|uniref:DDE_3 domain-containing protein n=1 Tax=Heligmosomoides polygyrus TaxID=6339 RepID=A0A3P8AC02_HELPZ|nr:unnamed protein product [Heligmosomoides polygyrus]